MRLPRIDGIDLHLFEFDFDLTFMVFFLNAEERIYSRYGSRDARGPDAQMSLPGLRHTMQLVLESHSQKAPTFTPRTNKTPLYIGRLAKFRKANGCIHCHEAKEMLHEDLKYRGKWGRDVVWRYPPTKNLGFTLDVDRGNIVKTVHLKSVAEQVGLKVGDVLQRISQVPVRSIADVQHALDDAPKEGSVEISWKRNGKSLKGDLFLRDGWRLHDFTWRPSVWRLACRLFVFGKDLSVAEKRALGLTPTQTAFRQEEPVSSQAKKAGIRAGDVIVGVDGKKLNLGVKEFLDYVRFHYILGDRITIDVLRDGKQLRCPLRFR